jgi:hypothetical protein
MASQRFEPRWAAEPRHRDAAHRRQLVAGQLRRDYRRRVLRPAGQYRRHPAEVREKINADRPLWSSKVFGAAHERSEIDLDRIRPVVLAMPFDLMRHDMLMTYEPIAPARVLEIVGDLFRPFVAINAGRSFKG